MKASVAWYREVLNMSIYFDDEVVLSGEGFPAGKRGDRTHLVILRAEDPEIGMIGLLQWVDPPLPAPKDIPTTVGFGNPTFVVASDDAQLAWKRAKTLGTHIHAEPHEWSIRGANGKLKQFIGVSLFDPDGYFFELNELLRETDPEYGPDKHA
jgi:catechol 2,3-dioxygenase-like lactoylglutathione lyase family enzyme